MKLSSTQLQNYLKVAGIIVLVASHFGWVLDLDTVAFILVAVVTTGVSVWGFIQRFRVGDLKLSGVRK